jgi:hypothetical protein
MAVRFSANTQYLKRTATLPSNGANHSVCMWVKRKVDTGTFATCWYAHVTTGAQLESWLETETGGDQLFMFELPGTESDLAGPTLTIDTWFFIGYQRTNTSRSLYYGTEAGGTLTKVTNTDSRTVTNAFSDIWIAQDIYTEGFNGEIAYVRFWSTNLSDAEMDAEWRSVGAVKTASLYGDWRLATAATAATDSSGNANSMTVNGTPTNGGTNPTPPGSAASASPAFSLPRMPQAILAR